MIGKKFYHWHGICVGKNCAKLLGAKSFLPRKKFCFFCLNALDIKITSL